jgi:hypothetical protein
MIDQREVPTSVQAQYVTAMKYAGKKRLEVLVKDGVNHPDIKNKDNDEETNKRMGAWIHGSHLTDNKLLNKNIINITVDIGIIKTGQIAIIREGGSQPLMERSI